MSFSSDQPLLINQLPISLDIPSEPDKQRETLELYLKRIANIINTKSGGLFSQQEYSNSELYQVVNSTTTSNVYRKCFNLVQLNSGNIGGGATVSFAHNITGLSSAAIVYAGCTSTIPTYFSVMGYPTVYLTSTNVVFTNPLAGTPLSDVIVVAEYRKN